MAEALVNVLLERLAAIALDKAAEEFKLVSGVKKEVESLTRNLESIRAVLEDAEQRQVTEASVRRWLSELTEVSFEMDDVLDEWITEVLKRRMEKQEKHALAFPKKVSSSAFSIISGSKLRRLSHRRKIAGRIRELNERVSSIDKAKQSFSFQNTTRVPEPPQRQKTTSLLNAKTFGRDNEKNLIVNKLLSETSEANEVPLIIPIVGMGGMGKTTLSQLVYNDEDVKSHFDKRIWVCVSDPFEEIKIARAIIESLDRNYTSKNSNELQTLVQHIEELLEGTRFLLVLDDVWNPTCSQWEELIKPLRKGAIGSRVLVTTRKQKVVTLMNAITQMISLNELGEAFCLSLFYYSAGMDESSVSKEFHDIGVEIVKRCNGLPLAAKTLGGLMRNKKNIDEWRDILRSKTWELAEIQEEVFRPLLLSYHDLPSATKHCLLYCVIFSKDYVYDRSNLVEFWMSQDYLNGNGSEEKMLVGQNYFNDLVMRSFFQDIEVDEKNGNIKSKIHDIVHDFLEYLTENECLNLDFELDASEGEKMLNDKIRHLTLVHASGSSVSSGRNYKRLRTLRLIGSKSNSLAAMVEIVELKCLRTVTLACPRWNYSLRKIPETIGGLIHLRYLDLSSQEMLIELPSTMGSLYNLQTLRLVGCMELKKLDVGRLFNLRHLYVEGCKALWVIKGFEQLRDLQTLDRFRITSRGEGNKLEHLKHLQLQGSLQLETYDDIAENAGVIVNQTHLLQLKLNFGLSFGARHRETMDGLEPHSGMVSLSIEYYEGVAFSPWLLSLHSLRFLTLHGCNNVKLLPSLGKLASLDSLDIENHSGVEKVGVEFLGREVEQSSTSSFPKLKQLTIDFMRAWEEWEGVEEVNSEIMPCLSRLTIKHCYKLKALPDFLWKTPLQKLIISSSPILENLYRRRIGEQRAMISHIPNIEM